MRKAITRNLTPKKTWETYVGTSEEMFISNFMAETTPITDITKMCEIYAKEIPGIFETDKVLFTDKQLKELERLITEHLENYIKGKGGINKLEILTEDELDQIAMEDHEIIMNLLADRFNTTREEVSKVFRDDK